MSELTPFWNGWVWILTAVNIAACFWLIWWTAKPRKGESASGDVTGHTWDGDLQEYNNPLPRWWLWMFYITLFFSIAYLAVYPGMGNFAGFFGWSSANQYDKEMARAEKKYGPIYAQYREVAVPELAKNAEATAMGRRLYLTSCIQCHGSDAQGSKGYPNLADSAWLWGGSPEQIKQSIASGRQGVMPPHQAMLNDQGVDEVAHYVLSLSGRSDADAAKAEAGKARYAVCQGCHMPGGEGNPMLGAPDLTDKDWLYGRHVDDVKKVIAEGKQGVMPAHDETLSSDKIHLLTAYVYSLSNG